MARVEEAKMGMHRPSLVGWGAIFAGTLVGLGIMVLVMSMWFAIAQGDDGSAFVERNLHWFAMGTAIFSLFVAGYLGGWLSGTRGWGPGMVHGMTVWAVLLVGAVAVGLPGTIQVFDVGTDAIDELAADPVWATFWSLLGGLVVATLGGVLGGAAGRPAWMYEPRGERAYDRYYDRDHDRDYDRDIDLDYRRERERERIADPAERAAATTGTVRDDDLRRGPR